MFANKIQLNGNDKILYLFGIKFGWLCLLIVNTEYVSNLMWPKSINSNYKIPSL